MISNLFYKSRINAIGGIETWLASIAEKYQDRDITVIYSQGDPEQIRRLRKFVRVKKWDGKPIKCKRAFFCYDADILMHVEADEYIMMIHGDYKALGLTHVPNWPKITMYPGGSQQVCDSFTELTGRPIELAQNPLVVKSPRRVIRLITASRLSAEKGRWRMVRLAAMLREAGIPFTWMVYTDDGASLPPENFVVRPPRLDLIDYIADADYLVQLSDTEGCSYAIAEALSVGTPVIVTDIPSVREQKVVNGVNGWLLPLDMDSVPLEDICEHIPVFTWKPPKDRWGKILAPGKSTWQEELANSKTIRCIELYQDLELERNVLPGEILTLRPERAAVIVEKGFAEYIEEE